MCGKGWHMFCKAVPLPVKPAKAVDRELLYIKMPLPPPFPPAHFHLPSLIRATSFLPPLIWRPIFYEKCPKISIGF